MYARRIDTEPRNFAWPSWQSQIAALPWIWLAFVSALLLYSHRLATASLNYDEGATLYFAHLRLSDLWGPTARLETNPPLFYTLEHIWIGMAGDREAMLRWPCVLAASLCVPVAAQIAARIGGRAAGIAAACLVATSPVQLATAQDARGYALLALCVLTAFAAGCLLLQNASSRPGGRPTISWFLYATGCIAAIYVHDTAVLIVAALHPAMLAAWWRMPDRENRFLVPWCLSGLAIAGCFAIRLPIVLAQTIVTLAHFWLRVPSLTDLRYSMMNAFGQPYVHFAQPVVDLIFLSAGAAGLWFFRDRRYLPVLAGCLLLGVPGASWLISQWRPILNGKTLEWMVPLFLILVALGCVHRARYAAPVTACLVALQLAGCFTLFANRPDEAFNQVAGVLRRQARPGDTLYSDPASNLILLNYYGLNTKNLRLYGSQGADPWFRSPELHAGLPAATARLWILTRTGAAMHEKWLSALGAAPANGTETFGRGRMRNLRLSLVRP